MTVLVTEFCDTLLCWGRYSSEGQKYKFLGTEKVGNLRVGKNFGHNQVTELAVLETKTSLLKGKSIFFNEIRKW